MTWDGRERVFVYSGIEGKSLFASGVMWWGSESTGLKIVCVRVVRPGRPRFVDSVRVYRPHAHYVFKIYIQAYEVV